VRWLVVVDSDILPSALRNALEKAFAYAAPFCEPVPLSEAETSIEVEGPEDLPSRLEGNQDIKGVYPSSAYTLD